MALFVREDWELFRTIDGLSHKAGVPRDKIAALVVKELVDNALDACGSCDINLIDDNGFYVQDEGSGLDPNDLADIFSIRRPLRSSKLLRLPSRGALGNGLRVVTGVVLATNGELTVSTQGKILNLIPCHDGFTKTELLGDYHGKGMRIEVHLGPDAGPLDLNWAKIAVILSQGNSYRGKTSAHWYTPTDFHELCLAARDITIRDLISQFDGCSGSKASGLTIGLKGTQANELSLYDATILLEDLKLNSNIVQPERLGFIGPEALHDYYYAKVLGFYKLSADNSIAKIPVVIEVWSKLNDNAAIFVNVNRSPVTGEVHAYHEKTKLDLWGCGLDQEIDIGRKAAIICLDIITPIFL